MDTAELGPAIKPLVWRDHRPDSFPEPAWSAQTPFGFYNIEEVSASDSPAYVVRLHAHHFIADKDSLEEAKAAAQADYEQRIRSALEDRRGLEPRGCPTPGACSCPTGRATPIAYITKAGLEKFRDDKEPESHVLLRSDGDLRVPLYDRDPIDLRWTTELSEIIGHLGSAIVQSTNSDDRIIMDHVRAAYEIAKVVRRQA